MKEVILNYRYHAEIIDDKIFLVSEKDQTVLVGNKYVAILSKIINEGKSIESLVRNLQHQFNPFEILQTIHTLIQNEYIVEYQETLSDHYCAYWLNQGMDINKLSNSLIDNPISLEIKASVDEKIFIDAFKSVGIRLDKNAHYKVVIVDDYKNQYLEEINNAALISQQPWLLIKPIDNDIWIGPLFVPGETGCYRCLAHRLEINSPIDTFFKSQSNSNKYLPKRDSYLSGTLQIAANHAALEVVKWLYNSRNEQLEGKIHAINCQTLERSQHILTKRPQCPLCGEAEIKFPDKIRLSKNKSFCTTVQGGYRERSQEETLEAFQHHVSNITGIVQELKPYHRKEKAPMYNYLSGQNLAFRSKNFFWVNQHIRSASGGKGRSWSQAKVGALCEAIERYCLTYQGDEYKIKNSFKKMGDQALLPNSCMNYSSRQIENREQYNKDYSKFYSLVPIPFDEEKELDWSPVYSFANNDFIYLPSCYCYAQYPAEDEKRLIAYPDSNGCAAGNSIEEAILQGFLELIERDSVAIWWYNRIKRPGVDIASFNDPYFNQLIQYYHSIDRSLFVLDLTADFGVPTFGAISHRLQSEKHNILFGFGSHVDVKIALERALVELNQLMPIAHVSEEQIEKGEYLTKDKTFINWLDNATIENQPYIVPDTTQPLKSAKDYHKLCEANIYDSVTYCIDKAKENGMDTLVLDLTRQDVQMPVVKVIVPGMRHFWPRFGPGRLYDVPVKLGWLNRANKEEELNPVPLFI